MLVRRILKFIGIGTFLTVIAVVVGLIWRTSLQRDVAAERPVIDTAIGIDELFEAEIGGIRQWFHVRGVNAGNPVLLYLHGGPGTPMMPFSHLFQNGWEQDFTVVHWDQRGAGKTYNSNKGLDYSGTVSYELMVQDAMEVLDLLKQRYSKQKIAVLGHSWGSMLSLALLQARPNDIAAYVGTGQLVDVMKNERVGYHITLSEARKRDDLEAIDALEVLEPYPENGYRDPAKVKVLRYWQNIYGLGGSRRFRRALVDTMIETALASPEYSLRDISFFLKDGKERSEMWPTLTHNVNVFKAENLGMDYKVPMFLFLGRYDAQTPSILVDDWLKAITAPSKRVVWFEESAHSPMVDEPVKFAAALIELVRPIVVDNGGH